MSDAVDSRGVYIGDGATACFGVYHGAAAASGAVAALICPPFGWEDFCSYRPRRSWAIELAANGHPTLRIDLPATGDGGGSPQQAGLLATWVGATADSAAWLRRESGCTRVALIGIGLGGLLGLVATAEGAAIDDLVLWGVPARGRTMVRELRAFARLNPVGVDPADAARPAAPPEAAPTPAGDSLEVSGFLLGPDLLQALQALDLERLKLPPHRDRRVLALTRDAIPPDQRLLSFLHGSGAAVTELETTGYTAMMAHPQEARAPRAEFAAVESWLAAAASTAAAEVVTGGSRPAVLSPGVEGLQIRERPFYVPQSAGRLAGVLAEPLAPPAAGLCAVLLNAGALRRIGPGRLWVNIARQWAARGIPSLRLDLAGIGDSDGDGSPYVDTGALYSLGLVDQVVDALEALEEEGLPPRFVLMGLCSGAYWSFHTALRDSRVRAVFMINPRALFWNPTVEGTRSLRAAMQPATWRRVLKGEVSTEFGRRARKAFRAAPYIYRRPTRTRMRKLSQSLRQLNDADQRTLFAFGSNEPLHAEMQSRPVDEIARYPLIDLERIPGSDHTLRPIQTQRYVESFLESAMEAEIQRNASSIPR